jgi:hypothetical protein
MKTLTTLIALFLLCLFVGCGGDTDEVTNGSEDKIPDVATLIGSATLAGENDHSGIIINLYSDGSPVDLSETDASGSYSIGLKRTGNYTLEFEKDGFVTAIQEMTIAEGDNSAEAVTLEAGGIITGAVAFDVKSPDKPQIKVTVTNEANGQETIQELEREEKYRVTVLPGSYTVIVEDAAPDSEFPPVEHEGVEVKIGDVILLDATLSTWPYFEAEDATKIVAPMRIEEDVAASGGEYLIGDGQGYAIYDVMIPEDGDYVIWGRILGTDGGSDSFSVGVNVDDPGNIWDVPQGGWTWDEVSNRNGANPVIFEMSKGKNSIMVKTREMGTKLDQLFLTTNRNARP